MKVCLTDFRSNITYSTQEEWLRKDLTVVRGQPETKALLEQGGHESGTGQGLTMGFFFIKNNYCYF
jgi:hypothetical protein